MNYSKNMKKRSIAKRVIATWVAIAVVFGLVGVCVGVRIAKANEQKEVLIYGTAADGKIFTGEMSQDWGGDLDFEALEAVDLDEELQQFIYYLCAGYNIDWTLVCAIIQAESSYNPDVISESGDYGLMQINEVNHAYITEQLGIEDFLDPYENVRAGCFILRKLFEKYEDVNYVLMAYHLGETGASTLWEQGIRETAYTDKVLEIQEELNTND